jgi:hypothetical protein
MKSTKQRRLWYDITMALTFPAVLGAVIYSLLDTGMREGFANLLVFLNIVGDRDIVSSAPQPTLLSALQLSPKAGSIAYLLITLFVAVQYSCDYLYSKYFETNYRFEHFLYDLIISSALGISFVGFSAGVRGNFILLRASFMVLWLGFILSYLTYLVWDYRAFLQTKKLNNYMASFFHGMVVFEIFCVAANTILLIFTFLLGGSIKVGLWYIMACLVVMAALSLWFSLKVWRLETLTRTTEQENGSDNNTA